MDHSRAPVPIEGGRFRDLLIVRDLASGCTLAALPVEDAGARLVREELERLFVQHGPPLVLKSDNGSALRAGIVQALLREHKVIPLYSPPGLPAYNGACEAGVGSIKRRADARATQQGHPGHWTLDDVEHARCEANLLGRPRGAAHDASPRSVWAARPSISDAQRDRFRRAIEARERTERHAAGIAPDAELDHFTQASIDRVAIRGALVDHGFLLVRRTRVSTRISSTKPGIIS